MASREPRAIEVTAKFIVRNVQAESFEAAKETAREFAKPYLIGWPRLSGFAAKEVDGSYTVEFR